MVRVVNFIHSRGLLEDEMTDDPDDATPMWSPAAFAKQMQEASQQATKSHPEFVLAKNNLKAMQHAQKQASQGNAQVGAGG